MAARASFLLALPTPSAASPTSSPPPAVCQVGSCCSCSLFSYNPLLSFPTHTLSSFLMGDLGHPLPSAVNCRKRKADPDDECPHQDSPSPPDDMLVEGPSHCPSYAPRQPPSSPWLSTDTARAVWPSHPSPADNSPASPVNPATPTDVPSLPSPKRPRVDTSALPPHKGHLRASDKHPSPRHHSLPHSPTRRSRQRLFPASPSQPLPSPPPLLKIDGPPHPRDPSHSSLYPSFPLDFSSPHIPSLHPLINRQTLRELDLSAILRNPQLRTCPYQFTPSLLIPIQGHDLLFDAGLQFRPTSGRRKRELSDRYWRAVVLELEAGCTCVSFDMEWRPCECFCVCHRVPLPSRNPILTQSSSRRVHTIRMPSRIRPLLTEFLEVLLFVIQPLTSISDAYANPSTFQAQIERHAAQAAHLRSVFDPDLIQQELQHDLFDPSGLFIVIGQTLKSHCAPMRDRAVDAMVQVAKTCAPEGGGTNADAVRAVRMCLEILESMKLVSSIHQSSKLDLHFNQDIANHQLQTLRPFLIDTSGQYELKAFKGRRGSGSSLDMTRKWIRSSHHRLFTSPILAHPSFPSGTFDYRNLSQMQKTYLSVLQGLTDLVFDPPSPVSSPAPPYSSGSATAPPSSSLPLYPETTYLDSARLLVLASDAADTTAMYMYLLLYRQLLFSDTGDSAARDPSRVSDAELLRLKREIRDISSSHLGQCFKFSNGNSNGSSECLSQSTGPDADAEREKWCRVKHDIILQIALRAKQSRLGVQPYTPCIPNTSDQAGGAPQDASTLTNTLSSSAGLLSHIPDERLLKLAQGWSDTHIQPHSPLRTLLKDKVRDAVLAQVFALAFAAGDAPLGVIRGLSGGPTACGVPVVSVSSSLTPSASVSVSLLGSSAAACGASSGAGPTVVSGMEPLVDELRSLAERLVRLAQIHLGVYLPLYEQEHILSDADDLSPPLPTPLSSSQSPSRSQSLSPSPSVTA